MASLGLALLGSRPADVARAESAAKAVEQGSPEDRAGRPAGPLLPSQPGGETQVQVAIDVPASGSVVGEAPCGLYVAGRVRAVKGAMRHFDVMIVIDTSRSTSDPAGADINGNGIIGKPYLGRLGLAFDLGSSDSGDSILAAEVAAARQIASGLDPRTTRLGVVTFAGDLPAGGGGSFGGQRRPPAITLEPLTDDYARIEQALDQVLARDPRGSTHMAAGVDQATIELLGLRGGQSRVNPNNEKFMLFFTDGQPTLPYGPRFEADNVREVLRAAGRAARARIRIHSFAIGPDALAGPIAAVEMASRTGGYFTPVRRPGDLVDLVEEVSFASLGGVSLRNLTRKADAAYFHTSADGGWAGLLELAPGKNAIEVSARAVDGTSTSRTLEVTMEPGAAAPSVPEAFAAQRTWLLEECLREVKKANRGAEQAQAEQVRRALLLEIERERAKARERADDQRKRLDLGVDESELEAEEPKPAP